MQAEPAGRLCLASGGGGKLNLPTRKDHALAIWRSRRASRRHEKLAGLPGAVAAGGRDSLKQALPASASRRQAEPSRSGPTGNQ
jgi:hypothetical protein